MCKNVKRHKNMERIGFFWWCRWQPINATANCAIDDWEPWSTCWIQFLTFIYFLIRIDSKTKSRSCFHANCKFFDMTTLHYSTPTVHYCIQWLKKHSETVPSGWSHIPRDAENDLAASAIDIFVADETLRIASLQ